VASRIEVVVAAFTLFAAATSASRARAEPLPPVPATAAATSPLPLVLELHTGWHDPLGTAGLSLVFDRSGRLSGGVGLGLERWSGASLPALGLFGRARLVQVGPFWLGATATLSRVHDEVDRLYYRQPRSYAGDNLLWSWEPGYRASAALGIEFDEGRWSARLEGGVGYLLNDPRCEYDNNFVRTEGCDSPDLPAAYRFQVQPGRVLPSATASLGYSFGLEAPSRTPAGKSPAMAFMLSLTSTLAPIAIGVGMRVANKKRSAEYDQASLAAVGAGIVIGPSVGHAYTGDYLRASGMALARTAGLLLFYLAIRADGSCEESPCKGSGPVVLGVTSLLAVSALVVYDIATAPLAARRANERNGLGALGVVPAITTGGPTPSRGLALAGRF